MEDGSEDASRAKELGAWLALVHGCRAVGVGCCGSRPKGKWDSGQEINGVERGLRTRQRPGKGQHSVEA